MQTNRILTNKELSYIKRNLKNTKKQLFWLFVILAVFVGGFAILVYTTEETNFAINLAFGVLILIIGFSYWLFKGYKKHKINPVVYSAKGYYKRIYESYSSRSGAFYDTISGTKVKLPWHWRSYLKKQKDIVSYRYIVRDGAVAVNELSIYVISVNDTLSLDYELNNGLEKVKPISLLHIITLFILPVCILMAFFGDNFTNALKISEALKNPSKDTVILKNAEEISALLTSNYIKIDSAWVYQYKPMSDYLGENYIITKTERDRIFNNPHSHLNYQFFVPSKYVTKPNKAKLKENLQNNPLSNNTLLKNTDSTLVNNAIENVYKKQLKEYNQRIKRVESIEKILEELKPKSYILRISENTFNAPEKRLYSISKSLKNSYTVHGFYDAKQKRLITLELHEKRKADIISAFVSLSICGLFVLLSLFSLFRIIKNSRIKLRLVKEQLNANDLKRLS